MDDYNGSMTLQRYTGCYSVDWPFKHDQCECDQSCNAYDLYVSGRKPRLFLFSILPRVLTSPLPLLTSGVVGMGGGPSARAPRFGCPSPGEKLR